MGCLWFAGVPVACDRLAEGAAGGNGKRAWGASDEFAGGRTPNFALDGGMEEEQDETSWSAIAADSIQQNIKGLPLRESNRKSMKCQL